MGVEGRMDIVVQRIDMGIGGRIDIEVQGKWIL